MAKAGDVSCMLFLSIACGKLYEESKQENKSRKEITHSRGSEKLAINKYEGKKSDLRQDSWNSPVLQNAEIETISRGRFSF